MRTGVLAPIVLFVYNRPWHTKQTVEALQTNYLAGQSTIYIFADAPQSPKAETAVKEVRDYVRRIQGFNSISIIERDTNYGLARSIIDGVTRVCLQYGQVIVLEDDMVTSPYFLQYMNDALRLYQDVDRVISIHGYAYPIDKVVPETYFLRGADCWGWATWLRGWNLFEKDGGKLLAELHRREMTSTFDFEGAFPYTKMLEKQIAGRNDSWAIRWYASALLANRLTLYPSRSLVKNIGNDASGIHCTANAAYSVQISETPIRVARVPLEENATARAAIGSFLRVQQGLFARGVRGMRRITGI